jgi:hypothetical protein
MFDLTDEELDDLIQRIDGSLEIYRQTYTEEELREMETL